MLEDNFYQKKVAATLLCLGSKAKSDYIKKKHDWKLFMSLLIIFFFHNEFHCCHFRPPNFILKVACVNFSTDFYAKSYIILSNIGTEELSILGITYKDLEPPGYRVANNLLL